MINLKNYVDFLVITKTTQRQFLLLMFLYRRESVLMKKFKEAFPSDESTMIPKKEIEDLVSKKFLIKSDEGGYYLGSNFLKAFITGEVATDEIYEIYPKFVVSDKGVNIPLTSMDKSVFKNIYIGKINGDYKEHKEVIKDIEYGVENTMLSVGIHKFVTSEFWKVLRPLRVDRIISETSDETNF
tara:strand:+ start:4334 stop:4885 length:552 start_codon:yes stop_codon:yes gene_type:complete